MDQRILLVVVVLALISISAGVPVEGQGSDNELRDSLLNLLVRRELAQQQQSDNDLLTNINRLSQLFGKK